MEKTFITYANEHLETKQIALQPLADCSDIWAETLSQLDFQSSRYMADIVRYYFAYFEEKFASAIDQSSVIFANNAPIGIWPLMIAQKTNDASHQFMTHGDAVLPPLFTARYPHRASNRLHHKLYDLMHDYGAENGLSLPAVADAFLGEIGVSEWYAQSIQTRPTSVSNHIQYAHLEQGMAFVESRIRKAYKPLINAAKKKYTTSIVNADNADDFGLYKTLHHQISGRITRNETTWRMQYDLVTKGQGFCVLIHDKAEIVGAAYFSQSADEVAYFSAAYNKDYTKEPLGHLTLYTAIEYAISHGAKWFRIGLLRQNDAQKLSDIDFFKNGFASHIMIENQTGL